MASWRSGVVVPIALVASSDADLLQRLLDHALDHGRVARVGEDELRVGLEIVVHEHARGVGMRRVLQHREVEAHVGPALGRHDRLDRQALQVVVVLQREGQVERELAARHAALAVGEVAREHRLLRRELLVELLAEGVVHDHEEHRAAAQRAIVVGQDLARPFGIEDVLPALGLVARLHQVAVDHQAVADDLAGDADVVGLVGRHDVLDVGHGAVRLEVAVAVHQPGGGAAVVMDVAQEAAGRLLDPHPLAHFAGARLQHLDGDAVLLLEGLDDGLVEHRADRGGVDDELAFLLGGLDRLGPVVLCPGDVGRAAVLANSPRTLLLNMVRSLPILTAC